VRKHQRDSLSNGIHVKSPPPKRIRTAAGSGTTHANGAGGVNHDDNDNNNNNDDNNGDAMDIDRNGYAHDDGRSPKLEAQTTTSPSLSPSVPVTPRVLTNSVGVQFQGQKIVDLGPDTIFLDVRNGRASSHSVATMLSTTAASDVQVRNSAITGGGNSIPSMLLLHCAWNPANPSMLLTAGTDQLAQVWLFTSPPAKPEHEENDTAPPQEQNHILASSPTMLEWDSFNGGISDHIVTSVAWSSDGKIAIASQVPRDKTCVLWSHDGSSVEAQHATAACLVHCLKWNPSNTTLLGLGEGLENSMAMIWTLGSRIKTFKFPDPKTLEDIAWISDTDFIVCGGRTICVYRFDGEVCPVQKYETADDFNAWAVRYDQMTGCFVTAVYGNFIDVS
jgi:hypothetical protein